MSSELALITGHLKRSIDEVGFRAAMYDKPGLMFVSVGFIAVLAYDYPILGGLGTAALCAAVAMAVPSVGLALARPRLLRVHRRRTLLVSTLVWLGIGVTVGLVRATFAVSAGAGVRSFVLLMTTSIAGAMIWMPAIITSEYVVQQARHQVRRRAAYVELLASENGTHWRLSPQAEFRILVDTLRSSVLVEILRFRDQLLEITLAGTARSATMLAHKIAAFAANVVRPLSHRLHEPGGLVSVKVRYQTIFANAISGFLTLPIRTPFLAAALLVVTSGVDVVHNYGFIGGSVYTATMIVIAGVLTAVAAATAQLHRQVRATLQWLALAASGIVVFGTMAIVTNSWGSQFATTAAIAAPALVLGAFLVPFIVAVSQSTREIDMETSLLERQVQQREADIGAQDLRVRAASVLHGPVQGRLHAVSLVLTEVGRGTVRGEERQHALQRALDSLDQIIVDVSKLDDEAPRVNARALLSRLTEQWGGILEVSWSMSPMAERQLERADLGDVAHDVIVDMVTNAARHALAHAISLTIDVEQGRLAIRGVNDTHAIADAPVEASGLAFQRVRSIHGNWFIRSSRGEVTSLALIPLTPPGNRQAG